MLHPASPDGLNLHSVTQVHTVGQNFLNLCSTGNIIRSWKNVSCFEPGWGASVWTPVDSVGLYWLGKAQIKVASSPQYCYFRYPSVPGAQVRKMLIYLFLICYLQKGTDSVSSCSRQKHLVRDFATCSLTGWLFLTALDSWIHSCQDILSCFLANPNKWD